MIVADEDGGSIENRCRFAWKLSRQLWMKLAQKLLASETVGMLSPLREVYGAFESGTDLVCFAHVCIITTVLPYTGVL